MGVLALIMRHPPQRWACLPTNDNYIKSVEFGLCYCFMSPANVCTANPHPAAAFLSHWSLLSGLPHQAGGTLDHSILSARGSSCSCSSLYSQAPSAVWVLHLLMMCWHALSTKHRLVPCQTIARDSLLMDACHVQLLCCLLTFPIGPTMWSSPSVHVFIPPVCQERPVCELPWPQSFCELMSGSCSSLFTSLAETSWIDHSQILVNKVRFE